jgi:hypothetical protein
MRTSAAGTATSMSTFDDKLAMFRPCGATPTKRSVSKTARARAWRDHLDPHRRHWTLDYGR